MYKMNQPYPEIFYKYGDKERVTLTTPIDEVIAGLDALPDEMTIVGYYWGAQYGCIVKSAVVGDEDAPQTIAVVGIQHDSSYVSTVGQIKNALIDLKNTGIDDVAYVEDGCSEHGYFDDELQSILVTSATDTDGSTLGLIMGAQLNFDTYLENQKPNMTIDNLISILTDFQNQYGDIKVLPNDDVSDGAMIVMQTSGNFQPIPLMPSHKTFFILTNAYVSEDGEAKISDVLAQLNEAKAIGCGDMNIDYGLDGDEDCWVDMAVVCKERDGEQVVLISNRADVEDDTPEGDTDEDTDDGTDDGTDVSNPGPRGQEQPFSFDYDDDDCFLFKGLDDEAMGFVRKVRKFRNAVLSVEALDPNEGTDKLSGLVWYLSRNTNAHGNARVLVDNMTSTPDNVKLTSATPAIGFFTDAFEQVAPDESNASSIKYALVSPKIQAMHGSMYNMYDDDEVIKKTDQFTQYLCSIAKSTMVDDLTPGRGQGMHWEILTAVSVGVSPEIPVMFGPEIESDTWIPLRMVELLVDQVPTFAVLGFTKNDEDVADIHPTTATEIDETGKAIPETPLVQDEWTDLITSVLNRQNNR